MNPPVALTIAGSDSGGGAGIQADLRAFAAHGTFGTSVLTGLTAQNTTGVSGVMAVPVEFVARQLAAVLADFTVGAAKTGMLASPELLEVVAAARLPQLVVDPVLVATSGARLYESDPHDYLAVLAPHATVLTPNLPEAEALLGRPIRGRAAMRRAATELAAYGPRAVLVKGGHDEDPREAVDVLWCQGELTELAAPRIDTANTHGTGCTLSAAIAAGLARGMPLPQAICDAKTYVTNCLRAGAAWRLGAGSGPLNHFPEGTK